MAFYISLSDKDTNSSFTLISQPFSTIQPFLRVMLSHFAKSHLSELTSETTGLIGKF